MHKRENNIYLRRTMITGLLCLAFALSAPNKSNAQEVIIDNGQSGTSYTGTWAVSGATNPYGTNSLWSRDGATYSWKANIPTNGTYEVYMWWTQYYSRSTSAPVDITYSGGTKRVYINQQINGGKWNSLGRYVFNTTTDGTVKITAVNSAPTSYCADAVKFVYVPDVPPSDELVIDNGQSGTSYTGTWAVSGATNPYGTNSLWSRDGATYSWKANIPTNGTYEVYMWWTQYYSRSTSAPVDITYSGGTKRVYINQQINGGKWNSLGRYVFNTTTDGTVKITAVNSAPTSYCADAVKFVYVPGDNIPPTASITSILPNPADPGETVTFRGTGQDLDGTISAYQWRSSIDGILGTTAVLQKSDLSTGTHSVYFKVQDNSGVWSDEAAEGLDVGTAEHIYVCLAYAESLMKNPIVTMLQGLGAVQSGSDWIYTNSRNKKFYVHFVQDMAAEKQALMTPGAHIIFIGHANYGLGSVYSTTTELINQKINNIYYIDDDRIFNRSSKNISVDLRYFRVNQAYPYFWAVFKDGRSGVMPFTFNDPRGAPPYNYYASYKLGSTYYKVETVRNSAIERFYNSDVPAWFSSSGTAPSPTTQQQYYITNYAPWSPSIEMTGSWTETSLRPGYYNENYRQAYKGTGEKKFEWTFIIPTAGNYKIFAWWPAYSGWATDSPFSITHASGTTTVRVNQSINGNKWNQLGQFYFNKGAYSVTLTNAVSSGYAVADAIRVSHVDNPAEILQSDFRASPLYGEAPLDVRFINQSTGGYTGRDWDFGDGSGNSSRDDLNHKYTNEGTYTVSLKVTNSLGSSTRTKSGYVRVGAQSYTRAEFSASPQEGNVPLNVSFRDRSSGNIVSWSWNFGDGYTSTSQRPYHKYSATGNYTVTLTVKDANGNTSTETKPNFVRAVVFEKNIDNVDYPLPHYGSRTIIWRNAPEVAETDLKYSRMFYNSCNSGNYFIDTFHRGIMFYTLGTPAEMEGLHYLQAYLEGKTDYQIWQILQSHNPVFDYYNFNNKPSEQQ
ncbi:MAG: PKD domain-containing protein [Candidatus Omnitrophica bacterium]|nr:PKD domain-containing protein [Candidatus Omnitrophota bacterium]MDD5553447.1 PKD domain-containing protein [Candidatus Omnitrophota bacterium]